MTDEEEVADIELFPNQTPPPNSFTEKEYPIMYREAEIQGKIAMEEIRLIEKHLDIEEDVIIIDYSVSGEYYDGGTMYECPECEEYAAFPYEANYCSNCGKKLKWIRKELFIEGMKRLGLTKEEARYLTMEADRYITNSLIATTTKEKFIKVLKNIPHKARYTKKASKEYGTGFYFYGTRNKFINKLLKKLGVDYDITQNGKIY